VKRVVFFLGVLACKPDATWVPAHAEQAERLFVPTEDGAYIHLMRYPGDGPAVLLCHGISSNHNFWDLSEDRSLAVYLHERGYDVWNMDLRGHGLARYTPSGDAQVSGWTVDDYGLRDLPAALGAIEEARGADVPVHYVGHSMGGMVLAVYLANEETPPLRSATTVGSPLDFQSVDPWMEAGLVAAPYTRWLPNLDGTAGAYLYSYNPFQASAMNVRLYNPVNMDPEVSRETLRRIVSPVSREELKQMSLVLDGGFQPAEGGTPYRERLAHVTTPMLFVAGRDDRVVPPHRVMGYYRAVGTSDKAWLLAGVEEGFVEDYGHLDLGLGDRASFEIFPEIQAWIEAHP